MLLLLPLLLSVAAPAGGPAPKPKLAVIISVDGLSWPRLEQYRPWYTSGLKRLLDEGRIEAATHYAHLNTETGPGHSSLSTGAPPRVTGIVANRWFEQNPDGSIRTVAAAFQQAPEGPPGVPPMYYKEVARDGRLYVFAIATNQAAWEISGETGRASIRFRYGPNAETVVFDSDDAVTLFNFKYGRPKETFARAGTIPGPGNLRVATLPDRLIEASPRSRVVSLSAKDRSAILLAGRNPRHAAFWFEQDGGRFVTSLAYDPPAESRARVAAFNRARTGALLPGRFGLLWKKLPPGPGQTFLPSGAQPVPAMLLADFQHPGNGLGFDHDLGLNPGGYYAGVYASPFIDELLADLAIEFVEDKVMRLGQGEATDLLALSFSAQDVVSHRYGSESEENLDVLRRLDLQLGRLFESFDRNLPKGSVVLALSSDHGFAPIPEATRLREGEPRGGRLVSSSRAYPNFLERLNRLLSEELCVDALSRPIYGGEGWNIIYNRPALPMRTLDPRCGPVDQRVGTDAIDRVLPGVLSRFFKEELEGVLLVSERDRWPADQPATEFARNDLDLARSGDAFLIPRLGVVMAEDPARGTGHGSHYEYDTHVPLVFWGGPFKPARSESRATPYDLAPTLARILGVALPEAVGRDVIQVP